MLNPEITGADIDRTTIAKLEWESSTRFFQNWENMSVNYHKAYKTFGKEDSSSLTNYSV